MTQQRVRARVTALLLPLFWGLT